MTAANTSSWGLVSCWLYFRHLFPVLPESPTDSGTHFSCCFVCSWCLSLLPLCCTEDSVRRRALTSWFSVLVFLQESSIKTCDHVNLLPENRTHATESPLLSIFTYINALKQINSLYSTMVSLHFSFLQVYEYKGIAYYSLSKTWIQQKRFRTRFILKVFHSI